MSNSGGKRYLPPPGAAGSLAWFLYVSGLVWLLGIGWAQAAPTPVPGVPDGGRLDIERFVELLIDPAGDLQIEQVTAPGLAGDWTPNAAGTNNFSFFEGALWLRFTMAPDHRQHEDLYLQVPFPLLDELTLYEPLAGGGWRTQMSGQIIPLSERGFKHRNFLFLLPNDLKAAQTFYLRVRNPGSMQFPVQLWRAGLLLEKLDQTAYFHGLYYGAMFLLLLASTAAFFSLRIPVFLHYSAYLGSYMLLLQSLNGLGYQYLWPEFTWIEYYAPAILTAVTLLFTTLFSAHFLQIWTRDAVMIPWFRVVLAGALVAVIMGLAGQVGWSTRASAVSGFVFVSTVLVAAIRAHFSGFRPARFFLAAWSIFLVGVTLFGLLFWGFVEHSFVAYNGMQIGSTLEILILGYALIDHIRQLQRERAQAIVDSNRYLTQLNEELEALAADRTKELKQKNTELAQTNLELEQLASRDSMTGLYNHRSVHERFDLLKNSAKRYHWDFSVVMLDIDHFKRINDEYGHPAGDQVILAVSRLLTANVRESDVCGRYGGEEFILLLPETAGAAALTLAERIRRQVEAVQVAEIGNAQITVSLGLSSFQPGRPLRTLEGSIAGADEALYRAKRGGRNRVAGPDGEPAALQAQP